MAETVTHCCKLSEAPQFNYFRTTEKSVNPPLKHFYLITVHIWRKILLLNYEGTAKLVAQHLPG